MDSKVELGQITQVGGSATASCSAGIAAIVEDVDMIVLFIGLGGLVFSLVGLIYTVWNGNRHYRLQVEQLKIAREELNNGSDS